MAAEVWERLRSRWAEELGPFDWLAVYEQPQPQRTGTGLLLLAGGAPRAFVKVRRGDGGPLQHEAAVLLGLTDPPARELVVVTPLASGCVDGWSYLALEPLPPGLHSPTSLDDMYRILPGVHRALAKVLSDRRPAGSEPMHGDLTPWNLRRLQDGKLALFDWEDAGWGPPGADEVLFLATSVALGRARATRSHHDEAIEFWCARLATCERVAAPDGAMRGRLLRALRAMSGAS